MLDKTLSQLEEISHKQGVDVALIADIRQSSMQAIQKMQLDARDTTGEELYHALLATVGRHDEIFTTKIGANYNMPAEKILAQMCATIKKVQGLQRVWVVKKCVAKELICKNPPRAVMKALGYRSVKSMLKRENIAQIYGAMRFVESPQWLEKFNATYSSLMPSDFETRNIEVVTMPTDPWQDLAAPFIVMKRHNVTHLKELGVVLLLPRKEKYTPGTILWDFALLLHYINEIKLYSSFFKMQQVKSGFGQIVADTLIADPPIQDVFAGQHIHWRVIQRYFGKLDEKHHPEIFEPHVQPEDLHWRTAEETLCKIDPAFKFWQGLDFVGVMHDGRPVSLNMLDVLAAYANNVSYGDRIVYHFRESLWNEIFARYMGQDLLKNQVLAKLNNDMIAPEVL